MKTTTKSLLVATLLLPFLMGACNRGEEPYSSSSAPAPDRQATAPAPTTPDKTMESAPPAAGIPPAAPAAPTDPAAKPEPKPEDTAAGTPKYETPKP